MRAWSVFTRIVLIFVQNLTLETPSDKLSQPKMSNFNDNIKGKRLNIQNQILFSSMSANKVRMVTDQQKYSSFLLSAATQRNIAMSS